MVITFYARHSLAVLQIFYVAFFSLFKRPDSIRTGSCIVPVCIISAFFISLIPIRIPWYPAIMIQSTQLILISQVMWYYVTQLKCLNRMRLWWACVSHCRTIILFTYYSSYSAAFRVYCPRGFVQVLNSFICVQLLFVAHPLGRSRWGTNPKT